MGPICHSERSTDEIRFQVNLCALRNLRKGLNLPEPNYHLLNVVSGGPGMCLVQQASPLT